MSVDSMMRLGVQAETAKAIAGGTKGTVTATGSTIADAAPLLSDTTMVTTAASAGVQLPDKEGIFIVGTDASNATVVYPHSSSGTINGGSAGAGVTVTAGHGGLFVRAGALNWVAILD